MGSGGVFGGLVREVCTCGVFRGVNFVLMMGTYQKA